MADGVCRYSDDTHEYRHVQLPKQMLKIIPKDYFDPVTNTLKLLWEEEWRGLGITQVCLSYKTMREFTTHNAHRVLGGSITRCTNRSLTYCSSSRHIAVGSSHALAYKTPGARSTIDLLKYRPIRWTWAEFSRQITITYMTDESPIAAFERWIFHRSWR